MPLGDQTDGGHDLAGRTVSALKAIMGDERGLQRMKVLPLSKPFNRGHLLPLTHDGERQTREDAPAIDEDGTGATSAMIAALLGPGQSEMFTQRIKDAIPNLV